MGVWKKAVADRMMVMVRGSGLYQSLQNQLYGKPHNVLIFVRLWGYFISIFLKRFPDELANLSDFWTFEWKNLGIVKNDGINNGNSS